MLPETRNKKAIITGITGQDGSYLAEFLLEKGYEIYGMIRRTSTLNYGRIEHILNRINIVSGDLLDQSSLDNMIEKVQPDEVYNLAAQSFVPVSWSQPIYTSEVTGLGVTRLLDAIHRIKPDTKFYQASTSEMFGKVRETPQNEETPFYPRSPYGVSKVYAHWATVNYRESYGMFATSGILFNHESPRRGIEFVTKKITDAVARIHLGLQDYLYLGNLEPRRDWGFAGDYVQAMWAMLQQDEPNTFVIGTDETHTIAEFCAKAFKAAGIDDWKHYVKEDEKFMRPAEVDLLISDSSKAQSYLGWKPQTSFEGLVKMMVEADIKQHDRT